MDPYIRKRGLKKLHKHFTLFLEKRKNMGGAKKYEVGEELFPGMKLVRIDTTAYGAEIYVWKDVQTSDSAFSLVSSPHMLQWNTEHLHNPSSRVYPLMKRWGEEMEAQLEADKVNASSTPNCMHIRPKHKIEGDNTMFAASIGSLYAIFLKTSSPNEVEYIGNTLTKPANVEVFQIKKGDIVKINNSAFFIAQTTNFNSLFDTKIC